MKGVCPSDVHTARHTDVSKPNKKKTKRKRRHAPGSAQVLAGNSWARRTQTCAVTLAAYRLANRSTELDRGSFPWRAVAAAAGLLAALGPWLRPPRTAVASLATTKEDDMTEEEDGDPAAVEQPPTREQRWEDLLKKSQWKTMLSVAVEEGIKAAVDQGDPDTISKCLPYLQAIGKTCADLGLRMTAMEALGARTAGLDDKITMVEAPERDNTRVVRWRTGCRENFG